MVDSLRYANLPPKLKHTAKTDGLEIVTYLENKLELNTLGSGLLSSGIGITLRASIAKKPGYIKMTVGNLNKKRMPNAMKGNEFFVGHPSIGFIHHFKL